MPGLSIEATLELWASSLREVKARLRPLFTQERVAASANLFLDVIRRGRLTPVWGTGLAGIRERAAMFGGCVAMESTLAGGTRLSVTIPVGRTAQEAA
jgi:signal transduction histidine kinase